MFNVPPVPETVDTTKAQGFSRYVAGAFHALAVLPPPVRGATVRSIGSDVGPDMTAQGRPLADHAALGCSSFEVSIDGETNPFVLIAGRFGGARLPCAQLVSCRNITDFVRFAGSIGRRFIRYGLATVLLDGNGPVQGLAGLYFAGRRDEYFRGGAPPRLGDLVETELVLFGSCGPAP